MCILEHVVLVVNMLACAVVGDHIELVAKQERYGVVQVQRHGAVLAIEINRDVRVDAFPEVRIFSRFPVDALVAQLAPAKTWIVEIALFE